MVRHVLTLSRAMEQLLVAAWELAQTTGEPPRLDHPALTRTAHRATVRALVSRGLADWCDPDGRPDPRLNQDGVAAAAFLRSHPTTPLVEDIPPPRLHLDDINVGDELAFAAEDPTSPRGERIRVTATVTHTTARSALLHGPELPYRRRQRYRLTREQFATRQVQRTRQVHSLPYAPASARIIGAPRAMWALYIPDPEQARDPYPVLWRLLAGGGRDGELIASAERHLIGEGGGFSGWLVHTRRDDRYHPPVRRREQARDLIRRAVDRHFA